MCTVIQVKYDIWFCVYMHIFDIHAVGCSAGDIRTSSDHNKSKTTKLKSEENRWIHAFIKIPIQ